MSIINIRKKNNVSNDMRKGLRLKGYKDIDLTQIVKDMDQ